MYSKYLSSVSYTEQQMEAAYNNEVAFQIEVENSLPSLKSAKIVDIGCGFGSFLNRLKKRGYEDLCGVEIGSEQHRFLSNKQIDVHQMDLIEFLKVQDERYDLITMFDVMEHFKKNEILEIIELLKKRLSKNGAIIVRVPNGEAIFKGSIMYGDFTHETLFTGRSLSQVFKTFGFTSVNVFPVYNFSRTIKGRLASSLYLSLVKMYKLLLYVDNPSSLESFLPSQNIIGIIKR